MRTRQYIRLAIFTALAIVSLLFVYKAVVAPPDPGYGRVFNFLLYGLLIFLIWIPYSISCMFLDGNKILGTLAVLLVALTLGFVAVGAWVQEFGIQTLALVFSTLAVPVLWVLSIISFVQKRRTAEQSPSGDGCMRSPEE